MTRGERGMVAGLDGLLFGSLVLLAGTILVVSAWSVLETRRALDGAAREYLRAYTESPDPVAATAAGDRAARDSLQGDGVTLPVTVDAPDPGRFGPCAMSTVELSTVVPAARLPFVGEFGETQVRVAHTEMVDAHREVVSGASYDAADTPCGD
jgi:hypothetical protein